MELLETKPAIELPSPEELARRRKAFAKILEIREKMPPLDCSVVELIRESREELEVDLIKQKPA